jgi:hypothetical protein
MILHPPALRLVTQARRIPARAIPFGLRAWSPEAQAIAILLEAAGDDLDHLAVAAQVPPSGSLAPATPVFLLGRAARAASRTSWFRRLRSGAVTVGRAPRCGALLMRGYVALGAGVDEASGADLVWGFSSPC